MAAKDWEAKLFFDKKWEEMCGRKKYYEQCSFFKTHAWGIVSNYWRCENRYIHKKRREALIEWVVRGIEEMGEIPFESYKEVVKTILWQAVKEA